MRVFLDTNEVEGLPERRRAASVRLSHAKFLVNGVEKPIVNKGFVTVPSGPGLGITLNDEVVKQHLLEPGYFEPTPEWDKDRSNDRLWS